MKKCLITVLFLLAAGLLSTFFVTNHPNAAAEPNGKLQPYTKAFMSLAVQGQVTGVPLKVGDTYQNLLDRTGKEVGKINGQSGFVPVQIAEQEWALFNDITADGHYQVVPASKICGFLLIDKTIGYQELMKKVGNPVKKTVDDPNYYQLIYHAGDHTVLYERRKEIMKIWILPNAN
ncbi:hypothetical protein PP175_04940 [Aneurinibacillus sp. Ricciae_BoGa-3]|uniref:hypothetical protein n=1 Tax=Aneurinibacillus sp. Ricciae_BoGa-3 TaxID=3022697 RepID=UPI002341F9F2|nr:hypothetical protein [Aneurinibacillus sp. Ricciae_BoGa-3]WCK55324.1 hypothetical protein PP175_04940 [Aneurinibacillus sp. Ricciae_BoGa-3]